MATTFIWLSNEPKNRIIEPENAMTQKKFYNYLDYKITIPINDFGLLHNLETSL